MDKEKEERAGVANLPFGRRIIRALQRLGVEHFIVSPGSRSTPLALAAGALGDVRFSTCLDERSAAYRALGRIKATRRPVALICTSGTAGAHYFPAVIEARESGLPLVILTADRPPELQQCHAGQTIDQKHLFGSFPVFYADLPLPEPDILMMRQVRELCRRAVEQALGASPGPVHLNCPFREPFFPGHEDSGPDDSADIILDGIQPVMLAQSRADMAVSLPERTLILAGPRQWMDPEEEIAALRRVAESRGWPILADGVNPLRYGGADELAVITRYDSIVRDDAAWEVLQPQAVLLWGEPPTSKVLRQRLTELDVTGFQIGSGKHGMNPIHGKISWLGGSVHAIADALSDGPCGAYSAAWAAEEAGANQRLERGLAESHPLFEGDVHRLLAEFLPAEARVFYTSSLAVRDAEWFMPARAKRLYPFSQRGANGIDGTLSLARGIAEGSNQPVFLVSGELAFLHDSNGMLGAGQMSPGVFVLLLNNNGGGIFELLPQASRSDQFEALFATPQTVDFKKLTEAHGGCHCLCASLEDIQSALNGWDGTGLCVAEVTIDRKKSATLHRRFLKG